MSGFLANLLSRSRGTADVVRPRLASRFEPGAARGAHAGGAATDGPADAPTAMGSAPIISSRSPQVARWHDAGSTGLAPHARHRHDNPVEDRPGLGRADTDADLGTHAGGGSWDAGDPLLPAGDPRLSAAPLGGPAGGRRQRRASGKPGERPHGAAAPAAARTGEWGSRRAVDGDDATPGPGTGALAASSLGAMLAQASVARGDDARRSHASDRSLVAAAADASFVDTAPAAALVAAARPPASLTPMPVPSAAARQAGASDARSRGDAAAAEPVIEISIGRIDVRATIERGPVRTGSSPAPAPVMGLEEYLQTRARIRGGSR